ncbi:hypothetical protein DESC_610067 [Desulfosarcina cetonica]|nr:hypothetical protein DESC_610067 [Desulfosarcina cetonica]
MPDPVHPAGPVRPGQPADLSLPADLYRVHVDHPLHRHPRAGVDLSDYRRRTGSRLSVGDGLFRIRLRPGLHPLGQSGGCAAAQPGRRRHGGPDQRPDCRDRRRAVHHRHHRDAVFLARPDHAAGLGAGHQPGQYPRDLAASPHGRPYRRRAAGPGALVPGAGCFLLADAQPACLRRQPAFRGRRHQNRAHDGHRHKLHARYAVHAHGAGQRPGGGDGLSGDGQLVAHPGRRISADRLRLDFHWRDLGVRRGGDHLRYRGGRLHHRHHRGRYHQRGPLRILDPVGLRLDHRSFRVDLCPGIEDPPDIVLATGYRAPAKAVP